MVLRTEKLKIDGRELLIKELSAFDTWNLKSTDWIDIMRCAIVPFDEEFLKTVGKEDTTKIFEAYLRVNAKSPSESKRVEN